MSRSAVQIVSQLEALTTDQPMTPARDHAPARPAPPLKHHQVEAYTDELRRLGDIEAGGPRDLDGQRWRESMGGDRKLASARAKQIQKILADQAPKRITGPRANEVYGLVKELRDDVFKPAMLPATAARRVPSGAVGHVQRTEFTPTWNRAAVAFKRAIRALDPENPDPDIANLERFRPSGEGVGSTATYMADAVIPGNFAFGSAAKENWPLGPPTADTALAQVERREQETAPPPVAATNGHRKPTKTTTAKRPASPAQLAHQARLKALNAERRATRGEAPKDQV